MGRNLGLAQMSLIANQAGKGGGVMGRKLGLAQMSLMVVYLSDTGIKHTCAQNMEHGML